MSMNRQGKKEVVDTLKHQFDVSTGSFLVGYQGLTVADVQKLKRKLRENGGVMQVAKARLMRLAAKNFEAMNDLDSYFKNQVALVFADKNPSAVAKVLYEASKANGKLTIIAGCVESRCLDKEGVGFVATLPSREVLLSQLAGVLAAPSTKLVCGLNNLLVKLVLTLKAIEQNKSN